MEGLSETAWSEALWGMDSLRAVALWGVQALGIMVLSSLATTCVGVSRARADLTTRSKIFIEYDRRFSSKTSPSRILNI